MSQRPRFHPGLPLASRQLLTPPPTLQTHPYKKTSPVVTAGSIIIPPVIGIDIVSTVATDIATAFVTVVANAVTNAIASALATSIFTDIANAIDIPVETVVAIAIVIGIATALDVVVDNVVVAIVEPRVQFPAGAPSVCLTHCHLWHSAPDTLICVPGQVNDVSLPPRWSLASPSLVTFPFNSLFNIGT